MNKVAVVYWSKTGNTERMAKSVYEGAKACGAEVDIFKCADFNETMVDNYDSLAFGCPAMGSEVIEEFEFRPMFAKVLPLLRHKKFVLFGSAGWSKGQWLRKWDEQCKNVAKAPTYESIMCHNIPLPCDTKKLKEVGEKLAKD